MNINSLNIAVATLPLYYYSATADAHLGPKPGGGTVPAGSDVVASYNRLLVVCCPYLFTIIIWPRPVLRRFSTCQNLARRSSG